MQTAVYPSVLRLFAQKIDAIKLSLQNMVNEWDIFDLASTMTLLLLLFFKAPGNSYLLVTILCLAGILHRPWQRSKVFWFILTVALAVTNYRNRFSIDNHQYLINYWCLAIFFSLLTTDSKKSIALSARLLIGLAFFFATLWKAISNDYLDGTFFHYTLLLDERFRIISELFGGLSSKALPMNYQAGRELIQYNSVLQVVQIQDSPLIPKIAQFLTWWTIGIEGIIAIVFLWPVDNGILKWRDLLLLLFLGTTYSAAPVIGFGWVLTVMGITQCTSTFKYTAPLYVLTFLLLQIYLIPWETISPYLLWLRSLLL